MIKLFLLRYPCVAKGLVSGQVRLTVTPHHLAKGLRPRRNKWRLFNCFYNADLYKALIKRYGVGKLFKIDP